MKGAASGKKDSKNTITNFAKTPSNPKERDDSKAKPSKTATSASSASAASAASSSNVSAGYKASGDDSGKEDKADHKTDKTSANANANAKDAKDKHSGAKADYSDPNWWYDGKKSKWLYDETGATGEAKRKQSEHDKRS